MTQGGISVTFLGTGAAINRKGRHPTGILPGGEILVDAPPQALYHMKRKGFPPENLRAVFFTHFHPDHWLGFVAMAQEWKVRKNLSRPIAVIGPPNTGPFMEELFRLSFPGSHGEALELFRFHGLPMEKGAYEIEGTSFRAVPMAHSMPDLGYVIDCDSKTLSFSGDTDVCPGLFDLLTADGAVIEMSFVDEKFPGHLCMTEDFLPVFRGLGDGTRLILCHLVEDTPDVFRKLESRGGPAAAEILDALRGGRVMIPEDLDTIIL